MDKKADNSISQEEAIDLLFQNIDKTPNQDNTSFSSECMDEYGNYVYSTDTVISEPNTAYGSSGGFNYLTRINNW